MPLYEYRCLECDDVFEQRSAVQSADDVSCPSGHHTVKRLLSMFAGTGRAAVPAATGCCGGACGCR